MNVSWREAEALAVRAGGHLVTISDQAEQDWLSATFAGENLGIGFNDLASEGVWVWSSGELATTSWAPGQPDNCTSCGDPAGKNIAVMNWNSPEGVVRWEDVDGRNGALIEVRVIPAPVVDSSPWDGEPVRASGAIPGSMINSRGAGPLTVA